MYQLNKLFYQVAREEAMRVSGDKKQLINQIQILVQENQEKQSIIALRELKINVYSNIYHIINRNYKKLLITQMMNQIIWLERID